MRLNTICLAVALAAAALSPAVAAAQQTPRVAPSAQSAPSARKMQLTRQYLDLLMTDQLETAIRQMIVDQTASEAGFSELPEADRRFIVDMTTELTTQMVPQMIEGMVPVYAAAFTEEELVALIAFYDTEMGRSIARKNVEVMPEANRAAMSVMPLMLEKMAARLCQHYGCTPAELEELRRGMREEAGLAQPPAPVAPRK